jgi:hypothetical protein
MHAFLSCFLSSKASPLIKLELLTKLFFFAKQTIALQYLHYAKVTERIYLNMVFLAYIALDYLSHCIVCRYERIRYVISFP